MHPLLEKIRNAHRSLYLQLGVLLFLLVGLASATYLAQNPQDIREKAAEKELSKESPKPEFVEGEILVKFRSQIPALKIKEDKKGQGVDIEKAPVAFDDVEDQSLPSSLKDFHQKYKIEKIEKVFKGAEDPQKELDKFKQKFSQELSSGQRKINEEELKKIDLSKTYKVSFDKKAPVERTIYDLSRNPEVEYVEPNYIFKTQLIPNDPYYQDHYPDNVGNRDPNWNPPYDYQWNLKKINMEQAWDITTESANVIVAVTDTGIDYTHPELGGCSLSQVNNNQCLFVTPGWDFFNNDDDPIDDNGHGTHVAGIISAFTNNKTGISGINWLVKILPVKVFSNSGYGGMNTISTGIKYAADNGAKVINMSFGAGPIQPIPLTLDEALNYANSLNVVLIAAAGNENSDVALGIWPANHPKVISVGATDYLDQKASFSNYGKVEVVAPGVDIVSLRAQNTDIYGDGSKIISQKYYRANGTSMAAPHVAGLATLVLAKRPDFMTNSDLVKNVIANGTDDLGSTGFDEQFGFGRINAQQTLSGLNTTPLPQAQIIYPVNDLLVNPKNGVIIKGITSAPGFNNYLLEYYPLNNPSSRKTIVQVNNPVSSLAPLGNWVENVENGDYIIELTVHYDTSKVKTAKINITVDTDLKAGWPVYLGNIVFESPTVADLNRDGRQEIIAVTLDYKLVIYNPDGTWFAPWPSNFDAWAVGIPAIGNLDSDTDLEIVITSPVTGENRLLVYNYDGTRVFGEWNIRTRSINSGISLYDLDNDSKDEALISVRNPDGLMVWDDNGRPFSGNWPYIVDSQCVSSSGSGYYYGYPSVANLDNDPSGTKEIVFQDKNCLTVLRLTGEKIFSTKLDDFGHSTFRSPAIGNLDNDQDFEIIAIDGNTSSVKVRAFHHDGRNFGGNFPISFPSSIWYHAWDSPSLTNIDQDASNEIIAGYSIYDNNGSLIRTLTDSGHTVWQTTVISGDIDNDSKKEFFSQNQYQNDWAIRLFGWKNDGTSLNNYPKFLSRPIPGIAQGVSHVNTPVLADLDNDSKVDLLATNNGFLFAFELGQNQNKGNLDWPMSYHDERHTGAYITSSSFLTPTPSGPTPTPTPPVCSTPWNFRGFVYKDGTTTRLNNAKIRLYGSSNQNSLGTLLKETQSSNNATYGDGYYKLDTNYYFPYYWLVMQTPVSGYRASRVVCGIGTPTCTNVQPDRMRYYFSSQCVGGGYYNNNNFYLSVGTVSTPTPQVVPTVTPTLTPTPAGTGTQITINARGFRSNTNRQQPKLYLYINGQTSTPAMIWTTTSVDQNYTYTSTGAVSRIDAVFPNQDYVASNDTTYLVVNSIKKGSTQLYDGPATCLYDKGSLGSTTNSPFDGKSTIACQHNMFWNGSLRLTNF